MTLIQNLCLLLIAAHLLGWLATRCGQPELLGHLIAGVLLGPVALRWVSANSQLNACADLAVLLVVISAGLKVRLRNVAAIFTARGCMALLPGIVLPAAGGVTLALAFGFSLLPATVVALCITVTALPVALSILASFGLTGTRLANLTIAGALLADVLVLSGLGMLNANHAGPQSSISMLMGGSLLKLLALISLLAVSAAICKRLYRQRTLQPRRLVTLQLSLSLLIILGMAAASDALGLHFAVGAFLGALVAGDYHANSNTQHPLRIQLEGANKLLSTPLFLAAQGTHFAISTLSHPAFMLCLLVVAALSKIIGGYWGARLYGLPRHEALGTGMVMNARGVMEMVVASVAYQTGLVDQALFSTLLIVGIAATLITPLLLQQWQKYPAAPNGTASTLTER